VFKITPGGTLTTLHSFDLSDGAYPYAGLVLATNGYFYGVTTGGGANGYGSVFEMTPAGKLTSLYSFCAKPSCTDGAYPMGALVEGTDGNLYGTTYGGGTYSNSTYCPNSGPGCGTVFRLTASGSLTTLYSFCAETNCADGTNPESGLVQATNGTFYGAASDGGAYGFNCTAIGGCGAVYQITPAGKEKTLYSFCAQAGCPDGANPAAAPTQASDGKLYGTTENGGVNGTCGNNFGCGTVFKITTAGTLTSLYSFCVQTGCPDGDAAGGLVQATDENFYGTTNSGGSSDDGTVFSITAGGALTTLHSFAGADGSTPYSAPFQATNGTLYGTTYDGGSSNYGTVFSVSVGLGPFVETNPGSGKVGTRVIILGTNLKGSTSVAFNGTAAKFKVVSDSEITTSVPKSASTGSVVVKTPKGKLKSNVPFRVTK
jgi:uncharacterized repeat protein (TIGR03803 family)